MADYMCKIRTNYFKVTDEDALKKLLGKCMANGALELETRGNGGEKQYCFSCDGQIYGLGDWEDDEGDFDAFVAELQKLLPKDDAVILQEVGSEKFHYLVGSALIITSEATQYISVVEKALETARVLLEDPSYETQMDY